MLDVEIGNGGGTHRHQTKKQQGGTDVTGQLRIIVLDASPTTRKILEVILQREGHKVACFDDPLEALRALFRRRYSHRAFSPRAPAVTPRLPLGLQLRIHSD